ncbi:hypothetical protein KF840_11180 [bacterium]|nr:hypothetical protein [bacterium]
MSDEQQADSEPAAAGTRAGLVILVRIAIMFVAIPVAIMVVAHYLF